jgi:hypothetical protein
MYSLIHFIFHRATMPVVVYAVLAMLVTQLLLFAVLTRQPKL